MSASGRLSPAQEPAGATLRISSDDQWVESPRSLTLSPVEDRRPLAQSSEQESFDLSSSSTLPDSLSSSQTSLRTQASRRLQQPTPFAARRQSTGDTIERPTNTPVRPAPGTGSLGLDAGRSSVDRRATRAICLGAAIATGWVLASACAASQALLPLGVPTVWCTGAIGTMLLLSHVLPSVAGSAPVKLTLTGAFLAVQLAAFSSTSLLQIAGTSALGVTIGLLPSLLMALPGHKAYQAGRALEAKYERVHNRAQTALLVPNVLMITLYFLNVWTLCMPILYGAAFVCQSVLLQYKTAKLTETMNNAERTRAERNTNPASRLGRVWQFAGHVAAVASEVSLEIGFIGISASCVAGAPWRYWFHTSAHNARSLPGVLWQNSNNVAHESAPFAAAAVSQAARRAA